MLQMKRTGQRLMAATCCLSVLLTQTYGACAQSVHQGGDSLAADAREANDQQTKSAGDAKSLLEQGGRDAARLCLKAVDSPRRLLNGVGTKANFRKFAEGMIDWAEKAQQVSDLAGSDDGTRARMRTLFHKHILDAETLPKLLRQEYLVLQLHLIADTVRICQSAGVSDADIEGTFAIWQIKDGAWADSYESLIGKAGRIAKSDWLREAMELVASEVAAGAVEGIARGVGLWNVEEGSWLDAMAGLATHLIVD